MATGGTIGGTGGVDTLGSAEITGVVVPVDIGATIIGVVVEIIGIVVEVIVVVEINGIVVVANTAVVEF